MQFHCLCTPSPCPIIAVPFCSGPVCTQPSKLTLGAQAVMQVYFVPTPQSSCMGPGQRPKSSSEAHRALCDQAHEPAGLLCQVTWSSENLRDPGKLVVACCAAHARSQAQGLFHRQGQHLAVEASSQQSSPRELRRLCRDCFRPREASSCSCMLTPADSQSTDKRCSEHPDTRERKQRCSPWELRRSCRDCS